MRILQLLVLSIMPLGACAHQTSVSRADGAPSLPPSASVAVVGEAPAGAIALGTVTVQSNNHQGGSDCEAQAVFEAKKLGATHVVVRPANSSMGRGPKCTGDAYYLAAKPQ